MEIMDILTITATTVLVLMGSVYLLATIKKDASIVDVAWGAAQAIIAVVLLLTVEGSSYVRSLVSLYAILWGARLAWHIGSRKLHESGEDKRYQKFRSDWGDTYWWRSFLQIYVLQGVLMVILAAPIMVVAQTANIEVLENGWLVAVGSVVWWFGFLFETVGDWQLRQFLKVREKGQIMTAGLWKYTRHPNYFGEVTQWWGMWLIVVSLHYGLLAIVSPLLITILILKVSGITMLERRYDGDKKYQAYKKKTSAFFPMPPRR